MSDQKQLSIAMLGHKRIPSREGGIEIVVAELSAGLVQCGQLVTCFNRKGDTVGGRASGGNNLREYKGVKLTNVFTVRRRGFAAVTSSVAGAIKAAFGEYDVVHFHAEGPAFMCWLPKLLGKRVVVTIHGLDYQRAKWGRFASWYILRGEKNAVKFADEIIVLSKQMKRYFKDTYGRETVFIPNGVKKPKTVESTNIARNWGLKKDSYILFLGRLVPEKGIHYLIEAYRRVKTEKKLVIAGGSSDTAGYARQLETLAGENVIFTGFQQGRVLEELYSNAYVYCLPSDLEGMPLSLLEALSYGNCCLTSNISECLEIVEDKAVTFQRGNVEELCGKLQGLCDAPAVVQKYKSEAAQFVCEKYNWDDVVRQTLNLYRGEQNL